MALGLPTKQAARTVSFAKARREPEDLYGLIEVRLPDRYLEPVSARIVLNRMASLAYCSGEIGAGVPIHRLQRAAT